MKRRVFYLLAALAAATILVVILFKVWRPPGPTSASVGVWGPSSYGLPAKAPGSEQGSVAMGLCLHKGGHSLDPVFVVWVGEAGGGRLAARTTPLARSTHEKVCVYEFTIAGVSVECSTPDGKSGPIKIGGAPYELQKGALFLILNINGNVKVKQLKLATLNLKPEGALSPDEITHEYLKGLATTNPEIKEFFSAAVNDL